MSGKESFQIRKGEKRDCSSVAALIVELADYEKMRDKVLTTPKDLERDGFEESPPFFHLIVAEVESKGQMIVIGFALYFHIYSTWEGRAIHLEDFYVTPNYRFKGVGTQMLRLLAKIAVDGNFSRVKFEVLDWNEPSITYYKKLGAINTTEKDGWLCFRFLKEHLEAIANQS